LLAFDQLARLLSFGFHSWQGWNDHLGVRSKQEVTQDLEIRVEALDTPLHWESVNSDHHALILGQTGILRSDVLIYTCNNTGTAHIPTQDGIFSCASISSAHD